MTQAEITTRHFECIQRTVALPLAVRAWHELLQAGMVDPLVLLHWEDQAIVGLVDGVPAGVLVFVHEKWGAQLFVKLGYVLPAHRRRGVYTRMFAALVARAQALKVPHIYGATRNSNLAMLGTAHSLRRSVTSYVLDFAVPEAPPASAPANETEMRPGPA